MERLHGRTIRTIHETKRFLLVVVVVAAGFGAFRFRFEARRCARFPCFFFFVPTQWTHPRIASFPLASHAIERKRTSSRCVATREESFALSSFLSSNSMHVDFPKKRDVHGNVDGVGCMSRVHSKRDNERTNGIHPSFFFCSFFSILYFLALAFEIPFQSDMDACDARDHVDVLLFLFGSKKKIRTWNGVGSAASLGKAALDDET